MRKSCTTCLCDFEIFPFRAKKVCNKNRFDNQIVLITKCSYNRGGKTKAKKGKTQILYHAWMESEYRKITQFVCFKKNSESKKHEFCIENRI